MAVYSDPNEFGVGSVVGFPSDQILGNVGVTIASTSSNQGGAEINATATVNFNPPFDPVTLALSEIQGLALNGAPESVVGTLIETVGFEPGFTETIQLTFDFTGGAVIY
jgi:hypothetical protein